MGKGPAPPSSLSIPTVTEDDLQNFHLQHFSTPASHAFTLQYLPSVDQAPLLDTVSDDDGLGYYADGTKRTLTDEQVAIFRHSEIQQLLREQRRRVAAAAEQDEIETLSDHGGDVEEHNSLLDARGNKHNRKKVKVMVEDEEEEDEQEYFEFLKREIQELGMTAAEEAICTEDVTLMYDDEPVPAAEQTSWKEGGACGRKRIVYEEEDEGVNLHGKSSSLLVVDKSRFIWPKIGE